ncbi:Toll/interleukin-1 receptor domain-containing protein [Tanacetum coccineum]
MTTSSANNSVFRGFFEKQKLTGPNFIDWYRQLRIVLSIEDKLNYLEQPLPPVPVALEGQQVAPEIIAAHTAWIKGSKEIAGLMLMTMEPEIQRNLENLHANDMLKELKTLFAQQAEQELLQTTRDFYSCKQEKRQSVSSYVLKMKSYIDNLERLGHPVTLGLAVSLILICLHKEFDGFVQNYNMHSLGKTMNELHAMLKLHEQTLPKNNAPDLHAIRAGKVQKGNNKYKKQQPQMAARGQNQGKGKHKLVYAPKPKIPPTPKREDPAKDSICHECGIFTIELNTFLNRSWIYDTGCGTHICNTTQGLRASRKLRLGALSLYMGNGQREAVKAIGIFYLCLPSGLEIVLNNFSRNNMVYFSAIPRYGIFEIDLSNSYANESSIYNVSNKRAKLDLDSALLWHCRLGHISKKRIKKLQHDGLLNSIDLRAFEKCVPCMSGKMARKPYTHQVERAKDLLGLIHTDVCGLFKIMSRQRANYFVTFTDDFSRYGYVYLLKHKHEVFETFKVFQKEVENQLGKTIKSLRSDREGKYMSQEFLDHLKDHGIITHRTPPYTPQQNGVSKRRNRTLLDMVQSMMSQTTLPKSFWDYALETATRILNMVPTKKVEKTPYEVWHGQAPKLSYLKVCGCGALVKRDTLTNPDKLEPSLITQEASGSLEDLEIIQEEDTHPSIDTSLNHEKGDLKIDKPQSDIIHIHRSTRTRRPTDRMCLYIDVEEHELGDLDEPANYKAAFLDPDGKIIGSKWLFKKKTDVDGAVHTYKAHLVAKGYTQTPGNDYEETFSPVADIRAIRILIAIAVFYDYEIWQIDVKTAFLNGYLSKEVYMEQPEGVKSYLGRCFAMEDLDEAAYILGIKIYRDISRRLIGLCQSAYIEKILKQYHMENSKRRSIPMQEKLRLSKSQGASTPAELKRMQNVPYASDNPGDLHWTTVKNILKYLRNTKDMFLTGYVFILNGGVVDWKSAKQSIFATLFAEAEYIAAYDASKKAIWVRKFISRLGVVPTIEKPISMYCDNTGAITIANESAITKGARHFRAKVHYLREVIKFGDIKLEKVHTYDNLADPFTKSLAFPKHSEHTRNIGMLPASSLM